MTIKNFVIKNYPTVLYSDSVDSAKEVLLNYNYAVVVDSKNDYYGLLTPIDVFTRPYKLIADCLIEKEHIDINTSLHAAIESLLTNGHSTLPVFENEKFYGILTCKNIFSYLYKTSSQEKEFSIKKISTLKEKNQFAYFQYISLTKSISLSDNWDDIVGIPRNELASEPRKAWTKRIHPSDIKTFENDISLFMTGETDKFEHTLQYNHPEKNWIWLYVAAVVTERDAQNKPSNLNAIFKDVSFILSSDRNKKQINELLSLFDETEALLYYKNLEGEYQYVNNAFAKYFNIDKKNIIGQKDRYILSNNTITDILENEKQVTSSGKSMTFEELLSEKDIDSVFLSNKTPVFNKNKIEGLFCVSHNISEQKKIEKELKITNRLLIKTNKKLFDEIMARKQLENENCYLKETLGEYRNLDYIVCKDEKFKKVLAQAEQVASSETAVLLTGETGTGKELIAKVICDLSKRKDAPYVKINCAAIPEGLIESELFGHEKGAFTGAIQKKIGKFELANGGTIFLDEVGELPLSLQPKLLRVLQEKEFERIGGNFTQKVDVRIISATNKDLNLEVKENRFRKDLYYRLSVFPINIPPLRERKKDIPELVNHFVQKLSNKNNKHIDFVSKETLSKLIEYTWPGNVRELENIIERAIIISKGGKLSIKDIIPSNTEFSIPQDFLTLDEVERNHILKILELTSWKLGGDDGAAKILGINRTTLYHRMKKLGIAYKKIVS